MTDAMKTNSPQDVSTLEQLQSIAVDFSGHITAGETIYLKGDLGAGKTTFTQMLLAASGVKEHIKSPTYTLYETYQTDAMSFVHMDLYRLTDPEELYFLGIEDLTNGVNILIVEWPDKGRGVMPEADWILNFQTEKLNRTLTITSNK